MGGQTDGRMDGQESGRVGEWVGRWVSGWAGGWTDRQTQLHLGMGKFPPEYSVQISSLGAEIA